MDLEIALVGFQSGLELGGNWAHGRDAVAQKVNEKRNLPAKLYSPAIGPSIFFLERFGGRCDESENKVFNLA